MARKEQEVKVAMTMDTSDYDKGAKRVVEANEEIESSANKTANGFSNKFDAVYKLVDKLLPRGLRSTISGFKQTQRAVKGASTVFKGLKKAIISTGLGALIVLLGEIIANWDDWAESIKNWTHESKVSNAVLKEQAKTVNEFKASNDYLIAGIINATEVTDAYRTNVKKLGKEIEALNSINLDSADALGLVDEAIDEHLRKIQKEAEVRALTELQEESFMEKRESTAFKWYDTLTGGLLRLNRINKANKEYAQTSADLMQSQLELAQITEAEQKKIAAREDANEAREIEAELTATQLEYERELLAERIRTNDKLNEYVKAERVLELEMEALNKEMAKQQAIVSDENATQTQRAKARQILAKLTFELTKKEAELTEVRNEAIEYAEEQRQKEKELAAQRAQNITALIDKTLKIEADANKSKRQLAIEELENARDADLAKLNELNATQEQIEELRNSFNNRILAANEKFDKEEEEANQKRLDRNAQVAATLDAFNLSEFEKKQAKLMEERDKLIEQVEGDEELILRIRQEYANKASALVEENAQELAAKRRTEFMNTLSEVSNIFGELEGLAQNNEKRAKSFAIAQVLLNQAQALSSAIKGASEAAAQTGPAAPLTIGPYIAEMVGIVLAGFGQVKSILSKAGASSGFTSNNQSTQFASAVPTVNLQNLGVPSEIQPVEAFVVESQLSYAQARAARVRAKTSL